MTDSLLPGLVRGSPSAIVRGVTSPLLDHALAEAHRLMAQRRAIAMERERLLEVQGKIRSTDAGKALDAAKARLKEAREAALQVAPVVLAKEALANARRDLVKTQLGQDEMRLKGSIEAAATAYAEGVGRLAETIEQGVPPIQLDMLREMDRKSAAAGGDR